MKECCKSAINRVELRGERDDITVHQCVICGRRHISLKVETGRLGATFTKQGE